MRAAIKNSCGLKEIPHMCPTSSLMSLETNPSKPTTPSTSYPGQPTQATLQLLRVRQELQERLGVVLREATWHPVESYWQFQSQPLSND